MAPTLPFFFTCIIITFEGIVGMCIDIPTSLYVQVGIDFEPALLKVSPQQRFMLISRHEDAPI